MLFVVVVGSISFWFFLSLHIDSTMVSASGCLQLSQCSHFIVLIPSCRSVVFPIWLHSHRIQVFIWWWISSVMLPFSTSHIWFICEWVWWLPCRRLTLHSTRETNKNFCKCNGLVFSTSKVSIAYYATEDERKLPNKESILWSKKTEENRDFILHRNIFQTILLLIFSISNIITPIAWYALLWRMKYLEENT